jgi:hypothetical protein
MITRQEQLEIQLKELQAKIKETKTISEQMEMILLSYSLENQLMYLS